MTLILYFLASVGAVVVFTTAVELLGVLWEYYVKPAAQKAVVKKQNANLVAKWEKTGLLNGLTTPKDKYNMSVLLDNQSKQMRDEKKSDTDCLKLINILGSPSRIKKLSDKTDHLLKQIAAIKKQSDTK